jgi:hypothetical protein
MTQFNWTVTQLYTQRIESIAGYVVIARYNTTGIDGQFTASLSNIAQFSKSNVSNFIPYEDLTEEIVLGWIKDSLGANGIISIEACIQGQIDSQINPPVSPEITPLPWN